MKDVKRNKVIQQRDTKLSNVYVEKRTGDIDVFVAGIMPTRDRPDKQNRKPVKASTYCKYLNLDAAAARKHFEKLKGQPFNFPLTHFPAVTEPSPLTSFEQSSGKRSSSELHSLSSERAPKRLRES